MRLLLLYLKRHFKIILMLLCFGGIFAGVFSLYSLPMEAVGYSLALCAAVGLVLLVAGFIMHLRRHRRLSQMRETVMLSLDGLPEPSGVLEEDYQELLRILRGNAARLKTEGESSRRDAADYYTLWVHQVKTPISAMRLLLQSPEPDAGQLEAELFQIEQYVGMALSYQRLDGGASDYLFRECDVDEVVRACLRRFARLFILRRISLDFSGTGLRAVTDEKWLDFVIGHLLSNALKYTPPGGRIRIYGELETLCISDNGIGIREEDLPRVFEKGFTGYNGREDKKSTGIGLYLCRRACANLGHGISIASRPGKGTTVRLDLSTYAGIIE
ncbi:MAG: sensor histidine kinase [Butyricicoccus sp.]|nr:sensor histidine kinase [Butyricicoccus sp.]